VETRSGHFVRVDSAATSLDVVGLAIAWLHAGVNPWEMEAPAQELLERLSDIPNIEAIMLLSRSVESFAGYYVRVRPQR
jgi:hypothetical protein